MYCYQRVVYSYYRDSLLTYSNVKLSLLSFTLILFQQHHICFIKYIDDAMEGQRSCLFVNSKVIYMIRFLNNKWKDVTQCFIPKNILRMLKIILSIFSILRHDLCNINILFLFRYQILFWNISLQINMHFQYDCYKHISSQISLTEIEHKNLVNMINEASDKMCYMILNSSANQFYVRNKPSIKVLQKHNFTLFRLPDILFSDVAIYIWITNLNETSETLPFKRPFIF